MKKIVHKLYLYPVFLTIFTLMKGKIMAIFQTLASLTGAMQEAEIFTEDREDMWLGSA